MHKFLTTALAAIVFAIGLTGCGHASGDDTKFQPELESASAAEKTMRPFRSQAELASYLRAMAEKQKRASRRTPPTLSKSLSAPAAPSGLASNLAESITNVQHAGVDEGGIVKVHGNHLVILRRGRLFTVAIGNRALEPISSVDAFGPDVDPGDTWYDEMLVSENTVAVIGYSYQRGGTEVGLFAIDAAGRLRYRSTYQLRSNDYYSSRNYASRLIGDKLIFYAPVYLSLAGGDPFESFPAVRKWHAHANHSEFRPILAATQVYRPARPLDSPYGLTLHTVTTCDLAGGGFDCKATSVVGPPGRVFYVSPESVYVWVSDWSYNAAKPAERSMLYRMPLDGSAPTALRVSGSPADQFSFLESEDGYLNVLVRSAAVGDGMWGAETASGTVALMRVPLESFSDGSESVPETAYRKLPTPRGYAFQNRFVGDYLLYGTGGGWGNPRPHKESNLYAVRWAGGDAQTVPLSHGVDRIEQMGSDAVVVGSDGRDLHFTAVRLGGSPEVADEYVRAGASQGELRSHGFFYKPATGDSGMLGLPIAVPARAGYRHLFESSAAILFLRNDSLHFQEAGELEAQSDKAVDDGCRASCVDWYGNTQPIFLRGRILALLGYELVEGSLEGGRIHEVTRVNYADALRR